MPTRSLRLRHSDLTFDCDAAGPKGRPLVLLLHGFPQTSHSYRHALPALARGGYFALAPNQRGYSEGARPTEVEAYATPALVADVLGFADAVGAHQFHLVGHDWGGALAWLVAARHAHRVLTLTVLSRPHPAAFAEALREDASQAERSRHHQSFRDPNAAARLLEDGARRLRRGLSAQGVPARDVDAYLARLGEPAALEAALNWYRARSDSREEQTQVSAVTQPTLYIWGDADATVGRHAAEATARYVTGPYSFEVLAGAGHFLTDVAEERITALLLDHLRRHTALSKV